jgi:hypothetical protein
VIIAEDLLLLAYDDESGAPDAWVTHLDLRLAGALLVELALLGRIEPSEIRTVTLDGKPVKPGRIVVTDGSPTGHRELDAALAAIAGTPRKPVELVAPLSRGLQRRLLEGLADRGLLRRQDGRILGIFPMTRWPAADCAHETEVRARLQSVLLDGVRPAPREAALLALAQGTLLVRRLVPKDRRAEAEARAKQLAESGWASDATRKAVDAAAAAVMTAVIVPAVIAPAISS